MAEIVKEDIEPRLREALADWIVTHEAFSTHLKRYLTSSDLLAMDAVALAAIDQVGSKTGLPGWLHTAVLDYWRNLSYYCGRFPLEPHLTSHQVLLAQISKFAGVDIVEPLATVRQYPLQARHLRAKLVERFVPRAHFDLVSGRIAEKPRNQVSYPRGYELLDVYVETGLCLARWITIDPNLQVVLPAFKTDTRVSTAEIVAKIDRTLGILSTH